MTNAIKHQHNSNLIYLKIKLKHLGAEGRINNEEQRKLKDTWRMEKWKAKAAARAAYQATHQSVRKHKIDVVRPEARATNLAYGFLRGRPYAALEERFYDVPNWERVAQIVLDFGKNHDNVRNLNKEQIKQLLNEWVKNHRQYNNVGMFIWRKPNVNDPVNRSNLKPKRTFTEEEIAVMRHNAKANKAA